MWAEIASAAIPAIASAFGQERANNTNVRLAREAMRFESDQSARQMAFQERMSSTAIQRAAADMRAAGFNPILALPGGASTPSGASAQGQAPTVEDSLGKGAASAMEALQLRESLRLVREQRREVGARADREEARNRALGFKRRKDGSIELDLTMPGIADQVQAEIQSAQALARLNELAIPEREAIAKIFSEVGASGKGIQMLLPLLSILMRGR